MGYGAGTLLAEGDDNTLGLGQDEGIRTRSVYVNAPGNTPLMVMKTYETVLADLGEVTTPYACCEAV